MLQTGPPMLPPALPADGPANPGSKLHEAGGFWKPGSCQNGAECGHCHLCPDGEIKTRKKARQTLVRLGLASPAPSDERQAARGLRSRQGSELGSTTGASSELEWTASEQESAGDSEHEDGNARSTPSGSGICLPPGFENGIVGAGLGPGFEFPPGLGLPRGAPLCR